MGVRLPSIASNAIIVGSFNGGENILATIGPFSPSVDNAQILLQWSVAWTAGSSIQNTTFRIRRGTTVAGPQVGGAYVFPGLASGVAATSAVAVDSPGAAAALSYVLTAQNGAGGTNTTIQDACLMAISI